MDDDTTKLRRPDASAAVSDLGWRYLLGAFQTAVPVPSLARAAEVALHAAAAAGPDADGHVWADLRATRVQLTVQTLAVGMVTPRDVRLVTELTAMVEALGLRTVPGGDSAGRAVQTVEIAVDALDIPAVRPFWKAVLGYVDEPGDDGPSDPVVDPYRQGLAVWFQQMDEPRPQRNRIHFDICVPHDEADRRIEAALAAAGTLVSDQSAPAFWVLADPEGNEVCVTTWQGRD